MRFGIRAWGWWGGHAQSKENTVAQPTNQRVRTSARRYYAYDLMGGVSVESFTCHFVISTPEPGEERLVSSLGHVFAGPGGGFEERSCVFLAFEDVGGEAAFA